MKSFPHRRVVISFLHFVFKQKKKDFKVFGGVGHFFFVCVALDGSPGPNWPGRVRRRRADTHENCVCISRNRRVIVWLWKRKFTSVPPVRVWLVSKCSIFPHSSHGSADGHSVSVERHRPSSNLARASHWRTADHLAKDRKWPEKKILKGQSEVKD